MNFHEPEKISSKTTATTTTTTTTTKVPIVIVEAQIHEQPQEVLPTLVPIPTLSTYTLKPSVLEKSVRKTEIKLVNPEGETITFPTSDIADLSVESLSNLLQAEMIDAQAPVTIKVPSNTESPEIQILQEMEIDEHSFKIEFDEYFDIVQSMMPKLESRLRDQIKRLDPKPKIFTEMDNFYYFSSKFEYPFSQGISFCNIHNAKYYEVSDFYDYNALIKLKNENGKSMKDYIIWVRKGLSTL